MPDLLLTANTSLQQVHAFTKAAGDAHITIGNKDGARTLHYDGKLQAFFNPTSRHDNMASTLATIGDFVARRGSAQEAGKLVSSLHGSTRASDIARATAEIAPKYAFEEMMQQPKARAAFQAHCKSDFCSESFNFREKIQGFRERAALADTPEKITAVRYEAQAIRDHFIKSTGAEQVNLPAEIVARLQHADFADMGRHELTKVFGDAEKNISALLKSDVFPRFQVTNEYRSLFPNHAAPSQSRAPAAGPTQADLMQAMTRAVRNEVPLAEARTQARQDVRAELSTWQGALNHPTTRDAIRAHGVKEYCPENMAFYEEVESYERNAADPNVTDAQLATQAQGIIDKFVRLGGNLDINIQKDMRDALTREGATDGLNRTELNKLFDPPKAEVQTMLERGAFDRLKKDPSFEDIVTQVAKQRAGANGLA